MKIFDLQLVEDYEVDSLWFLYVKVYDEPIQEKWALGSIIDKDSSVIGPLMSFDSLSKTLNTQFKNDFPNVDEAFDEIMSIHKINQLNGKNGTGIKYPLVVDFQTFDEKCYEMLF